MWSFKFFSNTSMSKGRGVSTGGLFDLKAELAKQEQEAARHKASGTSKIVGRERPGKVGQSLYTRITVSSMDLFHSETNYLVSSKCWRSSSSCARPGGGYRSKTTGRIRSFHTGAQGKNIRQTQTRERSRSKWGTIQQFSSWCELSSKIFTLTFLNHILPVWKQSKRCMGIRQWRCRRISDSTATLWSEATTINDLFSIPMNPLGWSYNRISRRIWTEPVCPQIRSPSWVLARPKQGKRASTRVRHNHIFYVSYIDTWLAMKLSVSHYDLH